MEIFNIIFAFFEICEGLIPLAIIYILILHIKYRTKKEILNVNLFYFSVIFYCAGIIIGSLSAIKYGDIYRTHVVLSQAFLTIIGAMCVLKFIIDGRNYLQNKSDKLFSFPIILCFIYFIVKGLGFLLLGLAKENFLHGIRDAWLLYSRFSNDYFSNWICVYCRHL
jgi:hypothetical protein